MNLVISKRVTAVILSNFSGHYLRNRSTLDIGVLGYIGIFYIGISIQDRHYLHLKFPIRICSKHFVF